LFPYTAKSVKYPDSDVTDFVNNLNSALPGYRRNPHELLQITLNMLLAQNMLLKSQEFIESNWPPNDGRPSHLNTLFARKEVRHMPWYTNPVITCKVLNRIANRHSRANLHDLKNTLDNATQLLWSKQEQYYNSRSSDVTGATGFSWGGH
jgi:hypothetical protein